MKIVTVVGARPQFIKAASVSRALPAREIKEIIVHTGQHFDSNMSDIFFKEMEIPKPDYSLEINSLGHGAMTGRMIEKIEEVLIKEKPNGVLVYGDTNSTLAGALAATKLQIRVAHVEAGLRSFDMKMPEEINRILTDRISNILFCPTETAVKNLEKEGFGNFGCDIQQPGDVMYDSVMYYRKRAREISKVISRERIDTDFVLATLHRAENTEDPKRLASICDALSEIHKTIRVVLPLHPRTRKYIGAQRIPLEATIIDPVGYFDMLTLIEKCKLVLTDSGGLQKEAYFFGKFCITLRDQTEWMELVNEGVNEVAGYQKENILASFIKHLSSKVKPQSLYGSGDAAKKIADRLKKF